MQNKLGDTALHAAAWKSQPQCVQLLLEHGAKTTIRNNQNKYPIDMAKDPECCALIQVAMRTPVETEKNEYLSGSSEDEVISQTLIFKS